MSLRFGRIGFAALVLLGASSALADWKLLKRDNQAMLSIDPQSIVKEGDVVSLRYMVDFRTPQGNIKEGPRYRSIVVSAKLRCKSKTISIGHTDAYAAFGAKGIIIAKTAPTRGEAQFHLLEKESSDQELWTHVCEVKLLAPPKK